MAWRRLGDKPLSDPMMVSLLTHICVIRPQWVILKAVLYCQNVIYVYIWAKNTMVFVLFYLETHCHYYEQYFKHLCHLRLFTSGRLLASQFGVKLTCWKFINTTIYFYHLNSKQQLRHWNFRIKKGLWGFLWIILPKRNYVITCPVEYEMKLLFHSQTEAAAS